MIGSIIDDRFEILKLIGKGGMGAVYEANDRSSGRRVAIKLIVRATVGKDAVLVARFEREARAAAKVSSEHIVEILATGHDPATGYPYMVMELLRGENLLSVLKRLGPLGPELVVRIGIQACRGLESAHAAGVVHRDIKPANLFLSETADDGRILKLLDFGVAKFKMDQADMSDNEALTRTGSLLGSPLYMSPEQARGLKTIDHRADIWSLGIVIEQLLTGATPHRGIEGLGELILAICSEEPEPLAAKAPWLSPAIVQAVHGALRLFPADRYQSAAELGEALGRCLADPDDWRITRDMLVPLTDEQRAAPPAPGAAPVAEDDRSVTLESAGVGVAAEVEAPPSSGAVSTIDLGRGKAEASTSNDGDEGTAEAEAPGAAADDDGAADETSTRDEAEQEAPASDEAAEAEPSSDAVAPAKVPPTEARRAAAAPAAEARGGGGRLLLAVLAGAAVGAAALWYRSLSPAEPVVAPPVTSATAAASTPTAAPSATAAASMPSAAPSATASDTAPADDGAGDGGAALPTGKIKIVPAFAGVVVDGRRVPVVDGAVSIEGAVGSSHTVILTVAGRNFETTVSITATGPVPSEIAFVAGGSRPAVPGGPTPTGSKGADPYDG